MNNRLRGALRPSRILFRRCTWPLAVCFFGWCLSAQSPIPVLPPTDSLTEAQVTDFAGRFRAVAVEQRRLAELQLHNAQSLRTTEETAVAALKADTLTPKDQITTREKSLKTAKNAEKVAQKNFRQSEKNATLAETIPDLDSLARRKALPKMQRQLVEMQNVLYPPPPPPVEPPAPVAETVPADTGKTTPPVRKEKKPAPPVKKYRTYDAQADVMLHPPTPPCALAMDRRDEFSGELQREVVRAELFRYTNPVLKTYLQGKTHILCEAALSAMGPNTELLLTFTIRDPNARKAFGSLPKNSAVTLQTLDGASFLVNNLQAGDGVPDETGQVFTFRGRYPLDRTVLKKLRSTGLDKVRVAWATGYEDYEVHHVDLLVEQASCLGL